jgi:hypothetical protein
MSEDRGFDAKRQVYEVFGLFFDDHRMDGLPVPKGLPVPDCAVAFHGHNLNEDEIIIMIIHGAGKLQSMRDSAEGNRTQKISGVERRKRRKILITLQAMWYRTGPVGVTARRSRMRGVLPS